MTIKCAVIGGSGYIGAELIRLLLFHPEINLVSITANDKAGLPLSEVHPNLKHKKLVFNPLLEIQDADVLFLALPHGHAMSLIDKFPDKTLIDTSADFRLHNEHDFEKYYQMKHTAFEKSASFCYGLPELFREKIKKAKHIASPGCFATAAILSIYPLIANGLSNEIIINAVTGSSGSGMKPKENTTHAFRDESFYAYEFFSHRHNPEIKQALFDKTGHEIDLIFQPHSGSFVRGIHATSYVKLNSTLSNRDLSKLYHEFYDSEYFIHVADKPSNIKWVQRTNFCEIFTETDGKTAIITTAIDNLLKGGAAQAIQSFNILKGFHETLGLEQLSFNP